MPLPLAQPHTLHVRQNACLTIGFGCSVLRGSEASTWKLVEVCAPPLWHALTQSHYTLMLSVSQHPPPFCRVFGLSQCQSIKSTNQLFFLSLPSIIFFSVALGLRIAVNLFCSCAVPPPSHSLAKAKEGCSHLTQTAWVQFLPSPTHETCLCCSVMSCLMKLAVCSCAVCFNSKSIPPNLKGTQAGH